MRSTTWMWLSASLIGTAVAGAALNSTAAPGPGRTRPSERIRLENPGVDGWRAEFPGAKNRWRTRPARGFDRLALPDRFFVPIFDTVKKPRKVVGRVRRGVALSARAVPSAGKCYDLGKKGTWYEVEGGGVICSTSGFDIVKTASRLSPPQANPRVDDIIPFEYARVTQKGAIRASRKPTLRQWNALASIGGPKDDPSGLMVERMIGDFFLSVDTDVQISGRDFTRNVHNEYSESKALTPKPAPPLRGERLGGDRRLPLAFVHIEDGTEILCANSSDPCGVAEKHYRFQPSGYITLRGVKYARGPRDTLIPVDALRIIQKRKRPPGVNPSDKWVHIDLAKQTFVAYEGNTPVYASLVSSGKEGHDTPTGLYRMQRKYLTKTMRAVDPKEGLYHIEDIPYVMYYYGAYALHGAFWHNTFGNVRSHGCTNLPPADARWLYHWSDSPVPGPWHARENIQRGTAFYFSN